MEKRLTVHLKGIPKQRVSGKSYLFNTMSFSIDSKENINDFLTNLYESLKKESTSKAMRLVITKWNISNFKIPGHSKGNSLTSKGNSDKVTMARK